MFEREVGKVLESIAGMKGCRVFDCNSFASWQHTDKGQMIFQEEIGAEYGGPHGSASLSIVYADAVDGRLTVIGDTEFAVQSVWGRLTLVRVSIKHPEEYYPYLQKLLLAPVMHTMKGVMIRLQPSEYKEWVRIHKDYVTDNSLANLFSRIHSWYKEIKGVIACESVLICSQKKDLELFMPLIEKHKAIMKAFTKRLSDHIKYCDTCDNSEICREINS